MNANVWYQHALANRLQSLLLLATMGGFLALLGWLLWGVSGIYWLLLLGLLLLLFNPVASPWLIMRMYRARLLTPGQAPALYSTLAELARRADLARVPELYYIPRRLSENREPTAEKRFLSDFLVPTLPRGNERKAFSRYGFYSRTDS